jgi:hypothetical protein
VEKLEGGKGAKPLNFYVSIIVIKENLILIIYLCDEASFWGIGE